MPSVTIHTLSGQTLSGTTGKGATKGTTKGAAGKGATVELSADVFGVQPNVPVMHQVVTAQLAHRRAGTQSTKTRAEVSGGGKKPFKQKGTGNARQGSTRAPHFSGGGVALGPKPRKYSQKTPKKMIRLALRSALSDRANEGKIMVIDGWRFDAPSTKAAVAALDTLGITGSVLVVHGREDIALVKSFRNLQNVQLIEVSELNAYDVLCNETIVFTTENLPTGQPKNAAQDAPAETAAAAAPVETSEAVEEAAAVDEHLTDATSPADATTSTDDDAQDDISEASAAEEASPAEASPEEALKDES